VAVPIVAQLAAAPLVVIHFRSLIPGALVANLAALPLIAPTVLLSVLTTATATVTRTGAALGLELVHLLTAALSWVSGPARSMELVAPRLPVIAALALMAAGWLGLQSGRMGRVGAAGWTAILVLAIAVQSRSPTAAKQIALLPIGDGAAILLQDGRHNVLVDAGRFSMEAARLLADRRLGNLDAVVATHTDEDHIGGMHAVLRTRRAGVLMFPTWMTGAPETVPLLREARRTGARVRPLARGVSTSCGSIALDTLWPTVAGAPASENERSLVLRATLADRPILLTSDVGQTTELRVARLSSLACDVLVVPHHGSRGSCSSRLLSVAAPSIALIPAAAGNRHGHPHPEVLERLEARGIKTRWPARDGACGVRRIGSDWTLYP
jgi:competence protein ComEC